MAKPSTVNKQQLHKLVGKNQPSQKPVRAALPNPAPVMASPSTHYSRLRLIRLHFTSPLHLSNTRPNDYGSSERVIHSDTFTAAIFQAWAMMGFESLIPRDPEPHKKPGFTVSSLFPFYGGEPLDVKPKDPVYFWPKPFFRNKLTEKSELAPGEAKKYKKVQYLDTDHFMACLSQSAPPTGDTANLHGLFQSQMLPDKFADFLTDDMQTRLTRPRDESEPTPYYVERLYFRYDSGLWCLIEYDNADVEKYVRAALRYLEDEGLGTDRAVGNGQFRAEFPDTIPFDLPQQGNYAMNLSLFCPESHEQLTDFVFDKTSPEALQPDPNVRYELVQRGGWLSEPYNTYRKQSVQMFRPGSLFRFKVSNRMETAGKLVNLKPTLPEGLPGVDHPIWRDGRALFVSVNL